jgi:hypothetical protein
MTRKVTVEMKIKLLLHVDEGVEVSHIMNELEYDIADTTSQATVMETEMLDYEITDSR